MNKYLSIITLNANGLNALIKRHRVAEWIRKHDLHICCLQETHLRTKDLHRMKVKGWKYWKQPKCPSVNEWIKKLWYIYTMEYYTAERKNEILPFGTAWMELESIMTILFICFY